MARAENEGREGRILAAAARLIVHFGYDKTTVDDIAREAGVSKGAIYLHFKGKDELFEALLIDEMRAFAEAWLQRLEADPRGGTIAGMYRAMLYALAERPFMAAMYKQDRHVFGSYLRKPEAFFRRGPQQLSGSPRFEFVRLMQEAGAVRHDLDPRVIAHIMNILAFGMVGIDTIINPADAPPIEELIEGIATLMDRALTPEGGGDSEVGKTIVRQIVAAARQQHDQAAAQPEE